MPGQSPQEPPVPESPYAGKPNTGGNASNSRFFSDCYSGRVRQISDPTVVFGRGFAATIGRFLRRFPRPPPLREKNRHIKDILKDMAPTKRSGGQRGPP